MKPHLACDYDEKKLRFPCWVQPKIDGVRGLNLFGGLVGRSLKKHGNVHTTRLYSHSACLGFDGELAAEHEAHPDLCRLTTSAVNSHGGEPFTLWHLFDLVTAETRSMPYRERYQLLAQRIGQAPVNLQVHLRLVPFKLCNTLDEVLDADSAYLDAGYEGTIIRDPEAPHKDGRCTLREGAYLRIKRFIEEDAVVEELVEGLTNHNEAEINELGLTERSTHAANMTPNGMVGCMVCRDVKSGNLIEVGPGKMPHSDRVAFWQTPGLLIGKTIKYKHFPKGVKDKPRFPTFQSMRAESDIS